MKYQSESLRHASRQDPAEHRKAQNGFETRQSCCQGLSIAQKTAPESAKAVETPSEEVSHSSQRFCGNVEMKTEQQFHREVDTLLDRVWQFHPELERANQTLIERGEAILEETQRNRDSPRLANMHQQFSQAYQSVGNNIRLQTDNLDAIEAVLARWTSPGRDYARFVDEARTLTQSYQTSCDRMLHKRETIYNLVEEVFASGSRRT
jgi:hypothetical protein